MGKNARFLEGITVLDLSSLIPGPFCSMILADFGAQVIKVEAVGGDYLRSFGSGKENPLFAALNKGKQSISLNLKSEEGREIFYGLVRKADVIIEGSRPGKAKKMGIGYEDIKKINQRIIFCSISGYGQKGPKKGMAGHDLNYISHAGLLDAISMGGEVPPIQIADLSAAMMAACAILAAIRRQERTAKGVYLDVSAIEAVRYILGIYLLDGKEVGPLSFLTGKYPCYRVYGTKDGKNVSLAAVEGKFWNSFCTAAGREDLMGKQYDCSASTLKEMGKIFRGKTKREWEALNKKHDFCCGGVASRQEGLAKKKCLPFLEEREHLKAPLLGQHAQEILKGAYSQKKIKMLRQKGVVV